MENQEIIRHEHAILCEGIDEKNFFINYLNSPQRKNDSLQFAENVDVFNFGGNEDLKSYLKVFPNTPGYDKLKSIMIIRDAEGDYTAAIEQIRYAIKYAGFNEVELPAKWYTTKNIKIAYLLLPSLSDKPVNGRLEDLCLRLVCDEFKPAEVGKTVCEAMNELEKKQLRSFSHPFKSKVHGFFSLTDKFVGMKIGEAAKAGAFDFGKPELDEINKLFLEVFN